MESFSRGWSFLRQAWEMAFKDLDLIKPSIFALIVGMIVSVIGLIPIIGAAVLLGDSQVGKVIMGVFGAILVFVQFVVSYVFSAMTVYLIYGYLAEGDGRMDKAWGIVRRDFFDILLLAAASTGVSLLRSAAQRNRRGLVGEAARAATGILQALWTEAAFLALPAMVVDDLNLKDALNRILKITRENLLLVGISTVGVRAVTGLIGFLLGLGGALIGLALGYGVFLLFGSETLGLVLGLAIGAIIFFAAVMVASIIGSYTGTAYHTCLYLWARETERARAAGSMTPVPAPAPLAVVLQNAAV